MRRFASLGSSALVVSLAMVVVTLVTTGAARAAPAWVPPVPGPVVVPFRPPPSEYGPGHRGVDYAVAPGDRVVAAGDGVVTFAGAVAGALHIVVAHHDGLRTTYSFVTDLAVHAGDAVTTGQLLARAAARAPADHPSGVLHFGVRVGDRYVDPAVLFRPVDLAAVVHLVPVDDRMRVPDGDHERSMLQRAFGGAASIPRHVVDGLRDASGAMDAVTTAVALNALEVVASIAAVAGSAATAAWEEAWNQLGPTIRVAWTVAGSKVPRVGRFATNTALVLQFARQLGLGVGDWLSSLGDCTPVRPTADRRGTGHLLMTVAGLGSTSRHSALAKLPYARLGYRDDEVIAFDYRGDARPYQAGDTFGPIIDDARRLGEQLRAVAREHPGQEVDLVGHSLGGVVIRAFLELVYDPADPAYPPLGPAIALAAPMRGAPLATLAKRATEGFILDSYADAVSGAAPTIPPDDAPVVRDLAEGSELLRRLDSTPLPDGHRFLSVAGADDIVVPADKTRGHGLTNVVVDPTGFDHAAVVDDDSTVEAMQLALDGRDPPCQSLSRKIRARVEPYAIEMGEHLVVDAATAAGQFVDASMPMTQTGARR